MASRLNWTVGITRDDLVGDQCGAVIGLHPQDEEWLSGERMQGVWFESSTTAQLIRKLWIACLLGHSQLWRFRLFPLSG